VPERYRSRGRGPSKNSGGRIAPAAIGALIEGGLWTVNAFGRGRTPGRGPKIIGKLLVSLNFRRRPDKGSGYQGQVKRTGDA